MRPRRALIALMQQRSGVSTVLISASILLAWAVSYRLGGSKTVGPQLFYIPIAIASVRFSARLAMSVALSAGLAAGPLLPLDVAAETPQPFVGWIVRLAVFVLVAQLTSFLADQSADSLRAQALRYWTRRELRTALNQGDLRVHYQAIVDLRGGGVVGAEALIRWTHPTRGPQSPGHFIPALEDAGVLPLVTRFVLHDACAQVARWRKSGQLDHLARFKLAVNISGAELNGPALERCVGEVLGQYDVPPSWLHLEVTETALVQDLEAAVQGLRRLRRLGVGLAIDDFGTGASSLTYLHRFPVDVLKIDRSFVTQLLGDHRAMVVAGGVVQLARGLSMRTVAEGIETIDEAAAVAGLGCDMGQGYLFSKPRSPAEFEELLARESRGGEARSAVPPAAYSHRAPEQAAATGPRLEDNHPGPAARPAHC